LEEKRSLEMADLHLKIYEKSQEIETFAKNDYTKYDAIAALSDKLHDLMEEVEKLKKRK
jgi:hypothetical protein